VCGQQLRYLQIMLDALRECHVHSIELGLVQTPCTLTGFALYIRSGLFRAMCRSAPGPQLSLAHHGL
jgi:hypothetical protein